MSEKRTVEKSVNIDGRCFKYRIVNGDYGIITGYSPDGEYMRFAKDGDGYYTHVVKVPEEIEGVPVLAVDTIDVKMKMYGEDGYRHNGAFFIKLILPEHTAFYGFGCYKTNVGYFYPNYRVKYYSRKRCNLVFCENEGAVFFAKPIDNNTCTIVQLSVEKDRIDRLEFPDSICGYKVTAISDYGTYKLPKTIKTVKISDSIRCIGRGCFRDLTDLENLYLGKQMESIADGCFYYYGEGSDESIVHAKPLTVYYHKKPKCSILSFVRMGELWIEEFNRKLGWVKIGEKRLEFEVIFAPLGVCQFQIEKDVLIKCTSGLQYIKVPDGIRTISDGAFSDSPSIKRVAFSNGVETIGQYAFKGCSSLEEVFLPQTLKMIGKGAFKDCISLRNLHLPDGVEIIESHLCDGCVSLKTVRLPQKLRGISEYAFSQCPIKDLNLSESIEYIRHHAFKGCKHLENINMAKEIENVDIYAFDNSCYPKKN